MQRVQYEFGEYVGEFDQATQRRHGRGTMTYTTGFKNSYDGEWKQGLMHGRGIKRYGNGDVYSGTWHEGKRHGRGGHYRYAVGHEFTGEYANDMCEGFGVLVLAHGAGSYEGSWSRGQKHGVGLERNRSHIRYEGQFKNGARHGFGTLIDEEIEAALKKEAQKEEEQDHEEEEQDHEEEEQDLEEENDGDQGIDYATKKNGNESAATKFGADASRFDTQWHEGTQIAGPRIEEAAARRKQRQLEQAQRKGPIADAAMLEALTKAGVAPEAVQALNAFSTGVGRSFGALDNGVAGMETHINQMVSTLDALLGNLDEEEEEGDEGGEGTRHMAAQSHSTRDDDDLEYAIDRRQ